MALSRRRPEEVAAAVPFAAEDDDFRSKLPAVFDFLALQQWPGGDVRIPGTLLLLAQDGVWKAWINDKDGQRSAFVSAGSVAELLSVVDEGLGSDRLPWRADKPTRGRR